MDYLQIFPHLNATFNALSCISLLTGFYFIKNKNIPKHRAAMLVTVSFSSLFLVCYVTHHTIRTYYFGLGPTKFAGEGWIRPVYFFILTSHTILAAIIAPVVIVTLRRALKGKFELHKKIALWTFPIWLYVSITGVIVYLLLYQIYPNH